MAYGQFAYYYDRLMKDTPYEDWLRFAEWCWEAYGRPETIVDLGCGTGEIAIPLALKGYKVTGIDLSDNMLAVAQSKTEDLLRQSGSLGSGGSVVWRQQDMCEWELPQPVDCVLSFCDCLNYLLEKDEVDSTFRQVYQGLKPGGLFIFDVHAPGKLEEYSAQQPFVFDEEDIAYIWTCDYDDERLQIWHELSIFIKESEIAQSQRPLFRRIRETHIQRAYSLDWLKQQLTAAGFKRIGCFADFSREPADERTQRAFFIAHKP